MKPINFKWWALSALSLPVLSLQAQEPKPTNVVYILADDLGIGDLGCYGQSKIKTPAVDKLAATGVRFTQHYTGAPVSAPSRCSLLTGKHVGHTCIRGNMPVKASDGANYDYPLGKDEITLGDIFQQKQYTTGCFGKWGLGGPDSEGEPSQQGFDHFYGYLGQGHAHSYYPEFLWQYNNGVKEKVMLNKQVYTHDLIMNKALDFINENASNPFFLYLSPTIPHADLILPEGELGEYDGAFAEVPFGGNGSYIAQAKPRATYAAMVSRLDRDVQRIVDLLKEKGIYDNTIIVFTSDNGVHQEGGHTPDFFDSNGIYRGYKRDLYEGGIRTPFIVSWPEKIIQGRVSDHPSAFWDFLPTVCQLIGVEIPPSVDGVSFLPTLTGEGDQFEHDFMYWEFHEQNGKRAVLQEGWKLIELNVNAAKTNKYELYNITQDPQESKNQLSTQQERYLKMKQILDTVRTTNSPWNFTKIEPIPGMDLLDVMAGKASTFENQSLDITSSYDADFSTLYHSKYGEKKFPVQLDYFFVPSQIQTIVYYTRSDNSQNGNFKTFEIWALSDGGQEYIKVGDYDLKGVSGVHRIDFSGEVARKLDRAKAVRFIVTGGVSDLTSCAEMLFYGKSLQKVESIYGMNQVVVTDATTTSFQAANIGIDKTYDADLNNRYHSNYSNKTFPIFLDYFFAPSDIAAILYYTRMDDSKNGIFKALNLWSRKTGQTDYQQVAAYNFNGIRGLHRMEKNDVWADKTEGINSIRLEILSGVADFASCAEIAFFAPDTPQAIVEEQGEKSPVLYVRDRSVFLQNQERYPDFRLFNIAGTRVDPAASLSSGLYLAQVGSHIVKVWIP